MSARNPRQAQLHIWDARRARYRFALLIRADSLLLCAFWDRPQGPPSFLGVFRAAKASSLSSTYPENVVVTDRRTASANFFILVYSFDNREK